MSEEIVPFGLQLQTAAERIIAGHLPRPTCRRLTTAVLARVHALTATNIERFARMEVDPDEPEQLDWPGVPLGPAVLQRLERVVGPAAQAVRVHDGPAADRLARAHHADAVTVGADVHFAEGRYRPEEPLGFALLAHEATHVAHALAPDVGWWRTSAAAARGEEAAARSAESAALRPPSPAHPDRTARGPAPARPIPTKAGAAIHPAAAPADRPGAPEPIATPAVDVEALRQGLLRELREQIRTDMERGA